MISIKNKFDHDRISRFIDICWFEGCFDLNRTICAIRVRFVSDFLLRSTKSQEQAEQEEEEEREGERDTLGKKCEAYIPSS